MLLELKHWVAKYTASHLKAKLIYFILVKMVDKKFKFLSWTRAKMVQYAALVGQATLDPFRSKTLTVEAHHG